MVRLWWDYYIHLRPPLSRNRSQRREGRDKRRPKNNISWSGLWLTLDSARVRAPLQHRKRYVPFCLREITTHALVASRLDHCDQGSDSHPHSSETITRNVMCQQVEGHRTSCTEAFYLTSPFKSLHVHFLLSCVKSGESIDSSFFFLQGSLFPVFLCDFEPRFYTLLFIFLVLLKKMKHFLK